MKIAVMGAGSVGSYYGAMMARAGHAVTLIARPRHVTAIADRGLLFETKAFTEAVPVTATTDAAGVAGADIVLFCVKSTDTVAAGRDMRPHLGTDTTVLSLQNGVDNAERLREVLGRPVLATAVYVATEMPGPGHVRHHGRGELVIGTSPASTAVAAMFRQAGVQTEISDNVRSVLWTKLIVNCAYNALSAIPQLPYGRMVAVEGVTAAMKDIVAECLAVAARTGVQIGDDILDKVLALAPAMPDQHSSTAQDLARGKRTEIEHLNGYIVREGERLGVPTPANRLVTVVVRLMEAG
jgi:2-dehydropantoate 2-reductase